MSKIVISDEAIESIILNAVVTVEGVIDVWKGMKEYIPHLKNDKESPHGVEFSVENNSLKVTVFVIARYGTNLKQIGEDIQKQVKLQVENITPFKVVDVNVIIEDIKDEG